MSKRLEGAGVATSEGARRDYRELLLTAPGGLRARLADYRGRGAVFAKWHAALAPAGLEQRTVHANAHALAAPRTRTRPSPRRSPAARCAC